MGPSLETDAVAERGAGGGDASASGREGATLAARGELGALGGLAGFFGGRANLCVPDFNREPSKIIIHENMGAVAIVGMKSLGVTWIIIYIDTMLMYLPLKLLLRGPCRPRGPWR